MSSSKRHTTPPASTGSAPLKTDSRMCTQPTTSTRPATPTSRPRLCPRPKLRPKWAPMHRGARRNSRRKRPTRPIIWCTPSTRSRTRPNTIRQRRHTAIRRWHRRCRLVGRVRIRLSRAGSSKCYKEEEEKWKTVKACVFVIRLIENPNQHYKNTFSHFNKSWLKFFIMLHFLVALSYFVLNLANYKIRLPPIKYPYISRVTHILRLYTVYTPLLLDIYALTHAVLTQLAECVVVRVCVFSKNICI